MLFNTIQFFIFLGVVLVLFYTMPRRLGKYVLLLASYYFYGSWNYRFIPFLLLLTLLDYAAGIWLDKTESPLTRKGVLICSISANLAFLGFFKYYNFTAETLAVLAGHPPHQYFRDIVLPLGISFHTFQSMSYVLDVYRRQQQAIRNPVDYALFICFFPQLVAGPIVRAKDFFRDYFHWKSPTSEDVGRGLFMIVLGLTKKMAFADQFANVANSYFSNVGANPGVLTAWSGVCAFGLQIYFDFSGYTDMAIGMAKLFGFHFPINFRRPYLAQSITDFWHRWHISLSSWLRDYLYIPLGGSRHGLSRTYANLMITMLLGGFWHGASWNFLIWGAYHGLLLSIERAARGHVHRGVIGTAFLSIPKTLVTVAMVMIGWVFFRAADFHQTSQVLSQMSSGSLGQSLFKPWHVELIVFSLIVAIGEETNAWCERIMVGPMPLYASALAVMLFFIEIFGNIDAHIPFVYFQF